MLFVVNHLLRSKILHVLLLFNIFDEAWIKENHISSLIHDWCSTIGT